MARNDNETAERRRDTRQRLSGNVTVHLPEQEVIGPAENVSEEGVFFVTDSALEVQVTLPGETTARQGQLVRVTAMGAGRVGVAIKFPPT